MSLLILGLIVFLAPHSVRIFADSWRSAQIVRIGERAWKGLYSLASIAGFVLLVWGYGRARVDTPVLWQPPTWTHAVTAVFTLIAFVLVVAAYVRGTRIKSAVHHPMILGVKLWAFGHLIANGTLADVRLEAARSRRWHRVPGGRGSQGCARHRNRRRRLGDIRLLPPRALDRRAAIRLMHRCVVPSGFG